MFSIVYFEKEVADHPQVQMLKKQLRSSSFVMVEHYMEVFNRRGQSFRLQKKHPALILARKHQNWVLPTPKTYSIGTSTNYYFSHLLNCPFDCRYCFLQGMYQSAHYVYFVNQEDFYEAVRVKDAPETTFFTGYDGDSLALESVTQFVSRWLPLVKEAKGIFEFRTKSAAIQPFLNHFPLENCVVAYTLTPHEIAKQYEIKAPSLESRIEALKKLAHLGWKIGFRFDPVLPFREAKELYRAFFERIFSEIPTQTLHSVTLGGFRLPGGMKKQMVAQHPKEPLFMQPDEVSSSLVDFCREEILRYCSHEQFFNQMESL